MLPKRGRPGAVMMMTTKRELTASDVFKLATEGAGVPRTAAPVIQKLRAVHHDAARHLASGKTIRETAALCGRTPQRISDLTIDPAFQELMAYYHGQIDEINVDEAADFQSRLLAIAKDAAEEIQDRLEDDTKRAQIPFGELRQIMGDALSRTVAPQKVAQGNAVVPTHITFNMGTKDIRPEAKEIEAPVIDQKTETG